MVEGGREVWPLARTASQEGDVEGYGSLVLHSNNAVGRGCTLCG